MAKKAKVIDFDDLLSLGRDTIPWLLREGFDFGMAVSLIVTFIR
jgi:hypothetical protein